MCSFNVWYAQKLSAQRPSHHFIVEAIHAFISIDSCSPESQGASCKVETHQTPAKMSDSISREGG